MDQADPTSPGGTSHAADRLLAQREALLARWLERVRREISSARDVPHPILVDTAPRLLRYLAEALSPHHPRTHATEGTVIAQEHGGERVRLTRFRLDEIIREYQLLREVVLEGLAESGPLSEAERNVILTSIDKAMAEACTAYTVVLQGLHEQVVLTLTHDLRGPLTAARASAAMILRKPDSPDVPRWAARAVEGIDRAERMVRDLLDVSLVRSGGRLPLELAPCELGAIAREVAEQLALVHGERFEVTAPEPVHGWWSAEALRRAIENLVTNAVKYGHSSRPITLAVRQLHARATVSVHNEGSYIPPNEQEALFVAFRRGRQAAQSGSRGWGLGLALVRGVAEAHGGSIEVDSVPERGTTFLIDIPLDARPYQDAPVTPGG